MTAQSSAFGIYFRDHLDQKIEELARNADVTRQNFAIDEYEQRRVSIRRALLVIANGIIDDDQGPVTAYASEVGERRANLRFSVEGMLLAFMSMRSFVWDYLTTYLQSAPPWTPEDVRAVEDILHAYQRSYFGAFCSVYQALQGDLIAQTSELERQRALIRELSSPIVPIYHGVLLLPLVGAIDEARAARITEAALESIGRAQAEIMLVDITGVPVVDTLVANHIVGLTQAASLLGAQVVLVGIRAEIAQTIIQLGIDIRGIITFADLQAGMSYALRRQGMPS
ncbi:MAG TPA: STAS domain-containing protein [Herpetosiphonaceae bacterium]